jgi:hypothetical protein
MALVEAGMQARLLGLGLWGGDEDRVGQGSQGRGRDGDRDRDDGNKNGLVR